MDDRFLSALQRNASVSGRRSLRAISETTPEINAHLDHLERLGNRIHKIDSRARRQLPAWAASVTGECSRAVSMIWDALENGTSEMPTDPGKVRDLFSPIARMLGEMEVELENFVKASR